MACEIDGCEKRRGYKLYCPMHYQRWRNHGDPMWEPPIKPTFCAVNGCGRAREKREYCDMHYQRWRATGDPGPAGTIVNIQPVECTVGGCSKPASTRGWCPLHYGRFARNGTLDAAPSSSGQWNGMWKGDEASYFAIHQRLKAVRGRASQHSCTECGEAARHWAYDNADPNERVDGGGRFSTSLNHYRPMCVSCHRKFDLKHARKELVA